MASTTMCFSGHLAGKAFRQQAARPARRCVRVAAESEEDKLSFQPGRRAALGYTDEDSAGQSNVFAVEPKVYVQGSSADNTGDATVSIAAGAFVFAMAAVGAGLVVNSQPQGLSAVAPTGEYKTLSQYKAQFAADIAEAAPALSD